MALITRQCSLASNLFPADVQLYHNIFQWMKDENKKLLEPFFVPEYNISAIWDTAWEDFTPCPFPVVQQLIEQLKKKGATFRGKALYPYFFGL